MLGERAIERKTQKQIIDTPAGTIFEIERDERDEIVSITEKNARGDIIAFIDEREKIKELVEEYEQALVLDEAIGGESRSKIKFKDAL